MHVEPYTCDGHVKAKTDEHGTSVKYCEVPFCYGDMFIVLLNFRLVMAKPPRCLRDPTNRLRFQGGSNACPPSQALGKRCWFAIFEGPVFIKTQAFDFWFHENDDINAMSPSYELSMISFGFQIFREPQFHLVKKKCATMAEVISL